MSHPIADVTPPDDRHPPDAAVLPTSFAQQRFWLLDQIQPGAAVYTMPLAYRLEGPLDAGALERALNLVIDRHEILRTIFALDEEAPVQLVLPAMAIGLARVEVPGLTDQARLDAVRARLLDEANRPFDLGRGPLIRATLYRLGPLDHVLNLSLHHIIGDGWSLGILFGDLAEAYAAVAAGREPQFPAMALQYADFAVWQRQAAERSAIQRQLDWWKAQLTAPLPILDLATDHPRPVQPTFNGGRAEAILPAGLVEEIRQLGRTHGATPFVTFLAAYQVLLSRMSRQDDVVVGSITSGRHRPETQSLIGPFVNTLAIRSAIGAGMPFAGVLAQVRDTVLGALANQDAPFESVIEALGLAWDRSRSPVFQAAFQLLEGMDGELALPGMTTTRIRAAKDTAKFELTLMLTGAPGGGLRASFEYNTDLYDAATVSRFLGRYRTLLEAIARNPATPLGALSLLPDAERRLVLDTWNATGSGPGRAALLHRDFERNAAQAPAATAVVWDGGSLSYRTLDRRANHLAARLTALGVGPDVPVAIVARNSPEALTAILAVLKAGGCYVPIDPMYPPDRIEFMLKDSGARAAFADQSRGPLTRADSPPVIPLAETATGEADRAPESAVTADHLAYIIYTSGSTGRPKGVMVPHRAVVNATDALREDHGFGAGDVCLQTYPMVFDPSVWVYFVLLSAGGAVALPKSGAEGLPDELLDTVARLAVTVVPLVPALLQLLCEADRPERANGVTRMFCGGEALAGDLLRRARRLWPTVAITNLYGPTEATIYATQWTWDGPSFEGAAPIGRPIRRCRAYVLDASGLPAAIGVPGELCLAGAGVARGYLNRPELTPQKFGDDPLHPGDRVYRTGDLARWRADGVVEFLGRLDDQVKIRGFRIELGEIEAALALFRNVRGAVAVVRTDPTGEARLAAYLVVDGSPESPNAIREALRATLPEYMIPASITIVDAFPLTSNGKVDRNALPEPVGSTDDRIIDQPATPVEAAIVAVMATVLALSAVGRTEDFFRLGGHSLLAMRMVARLRQQLGPAVTIQAVFDHPTPAGLASYLEATGPAEGTPMIPSRPGAASNPLSFAQELLWVQAEIDRGGTTYNIPIVRRLQGPLDPTAFQDALNMVVARHESLRSVIRLENGTAVQLVQPPLTVPWLREDLRGAVDPEASARDRARAAAQHGFDLSRDPLLLAWTFQTGPDAYLLLLLTHHSAADGSSVTVLFRDLAAAYTAAATGSAPDWAPLPIQFGDFAAWQRTWFTGAVLDEELAFWTRQLTGVPPLLEFPTDRPRTATLFGPGALARHHLPSDLLAGLKQLAADQGTTLYMVLLAAWQVLLYRYSGQTDFVVGSPVDGRPAPETEALIGNFVNTVLLRADLTPERPFTAWLQDVRTRTLEVFSHEILPLERLADALRARDNSAPQFQILFSLQNQDRPTTRLGDLTLDSVGLGSIVARAELSLSAAETPEGLATGLEYRTDLFDATTADRLLAHYGVLLQGIAAAPDAPLNELPVLEPAERDRLIGSESASDTSEPVPLHRRFEDICDRYPDHVAVVDGDVSLSYLTLDSRANALAHDLQRLGVGAEVRVGLCAERSIDLLVGLLAILKAGGAYVPIDLSYPAERVAFMLADAGAPLLVTQRGLIDRVPVHGAEPIFLDDYRDRHEAVRPTSPAGPETLAYVIYTSGSTGRPKGVMVTHGNVARLFTATDPWFRFTPNDVWTLFHSYAFDFSVWEIWGAWFYGGRLVVVDYDTSRAPDRFWDLLRRERVTVLNQTPSAFRQLIDLSLLRGGDAGALRYVVFGGEALDIGMLRPWFEQHGDHRPELINMYGITETTVHVTYRPLRIADTLGDSVIGGPIPDLSLVVLDSNRGVVPVGVPGELYVGGKGLARGYLNRPELTAERFVDHPYRPGKRLYRTGDRVRRLADGDLEYLGRIDQQVKLRGYRIELGEIESTLARQPGVTAAVVVLREDRAGEPALVAYYTPTPGEAPEPATLRRALGEALPAYMVPGALVALAVLPLTPNGKVDRKALPAPEIAPRIVEGPQTPEETVLSRLWAQLLRRTDIDRHDSFFDLGGHSLLAVRLVADIAKVFRFPVSLRVLFDHPSLAGMAKAVGDTAPQPGQARKVAELLLRVEAERTTASGGAS